MNENLNGEISRRPLAIQVLKMDKIFCQGVLELWQKCSRRTIDKKGKSRKLKIIGKRERGGESVSDFACMRSTWAICTILKNNYLIAVKHASKAVRKMCTPRLRILDDVERLLLMGIKEKQLQDCKTITLLTRTSLLRKN
ncbi:hypothetical protein AVEN_66215-1 [Araneus ventricosus]|uniref:Uncharacterized protein n=1 Tax=Araneus ventricosus TaxID=182803 RepID=A0A4Y2H0Q4_ARAVE|nr:hypothetical protein AVEN_66215-1 [Araneus ventricosus]